MSSLSPRAALLAAILSLPSAALALTCEEEANSSERLASEASAIIIGRAAPVAAPVPGQDPTPEDADPGAALLAAFRGPSVAVELEIEATEIMKGDVPAGVFRAKFLSRPCAHLPADGKRRILYLTKGEDGWRVLGSN
jgi:hypothetical protein